MKRFMPLSLVLVALAVLLAVPMYRSSAAGPATMPAASGQKWEYAQLETGNFNAPDNYSFTTTNFLAYARNGDDLLTQLGGQREISNRLPAPSETQMALFNQIGSLGWELASVAPREGIWGQSTLPKKEAETGVGRVYLFKRPASK